MGLARLRALVDRVAFARFFERVFSRNDACRLYSRSPSCHRNAQLLSPYPSGSHRFRTDTFSFANYKTGSVPAESSLKTSWGW